MPAGRCHGFDFSVVDPLFQGGIADAQDVCRFPRSQELLHDPPPATAQEYITSTVIAICFYTIREVEFFSSARACRFSAYGRCVPGSSFRRRGRRKLRARDQERTA